MNTQKGIVILFAVLVIGLLVGVGVAMATLTQKQLVLSNIGKQSQVAFYAADTGAECARYWDEVHGQFGLDEDEDVTPSISCNDLNNQDMNLIVHPLVGEIVKTEFELPLSEDDFDVSYYYCAKVEVDKNIITGATKIVSRGYNVPCGSYSSSRKVERAVRLSY